MDDLQERINPFQQPKAPAIPPLRPPASTVKLVLDGLPERAKAGYGAA
jgi:hypothetical protein